MVLICPNCDIEYREGFNTCADCGENLVEKPIEISQEPEKSVEMVYAEPVLLCSLADDINTCILISALKENDIQVLLKKRGMGGYFSITMGLNAFGVDIYVPASTLEKAQKLMSEITPGADEQEADENFESEILQAKRIKSLN